MIDPEAAGSSLLFVSDVHLAPSREASVRGFLDFVAGPAARAQALYILGDLFDYWAGDDDLEDPFNRRICAALGALGAAIPVGFLPGNRDFLIGEAFFRATRMRQLAEPSRIVIGERNALLLHGDTLCTEDLDYQVFRAQARSPKWRREVLALPLAERKRQIERLRLQSEAEKQRKPLDMMDATEQAVQEAFARHACELMIHGHTHRPAHHRHEVDGRRCERWVLPDWYEGGGYLACENGECRLVRCAP